MPTRTSGTPQVKPAPQLKPLRRDAAHNRERLLDAASHVFTEHGLDAGVEEVARLAGVGVGTLYRRFATKQALIDELVGAIRRELLELAREAATLDDGTGLEQLLRGVSAVQARNSGFLARVWHHSDAELEAMDEFRDALRQLLRRAQVNQRVRPDITASDISLMMWSTRGIIESTRDIAPQAWRRHLELLLAGLRPVGVNSFAGPLLEKPLTAAQVHRISATDTRR
jgi:AcrR family transcriptional regulator